MFATFCFGTLTQHITYKSWRWKGRELQRLIKELMKITKLAGTDCLAGRRCNPISSRRTSQGYPSPHTTSSHLCSLSTQIQWSRDSTTTTTCATRPRTLDHLPDNRFLHLSTFPSRPSTLFYPSTMSRFHLRLLLLLISDPSPRCLR